MKKFNILFIALLSLLLALPGFSQIETGYPLPFLEQWNTGTFETNDWLTEGENWSINWQEGQPDPSAGFTWDPLQNDYQIALESFPLLADSLTEGHIYLDFDIKLDNYNPTGNEELLVQVRNLESQEWSTVSTYSNIEGSFDWLSEHLDITSQAMGKVFKIRFLAGGENSLNILGWTLDNIHIYRACMEPQNLTFDVAWPFWGFNLDWDYPFGPAHLWLEWDDGVNSGNSIGTGEESEFDVAARWTTYELAEYDNHKIKKIDFFPSEASATYRARIWTGLNAENLVFDQPVDTPLIGQWNEVWLDTSLMIDVTQDLWIGYHIAAQTGYPAGVDDGPAIEGLGNMINFEEWQTLLEINPELDYNWNIKAYVEDLSNEITTKFAIYRKDNGNEYFLRDYAYENHYLDDSALIILNYVHCYKVKAIYISETDTCESPFSNEDCMLLMIGVNEVDQDIQMSIYPNPASDLLFIESSENIQSISIYDSRGDKVIRWEGDKGVVEIPVNELVPGLYLVRIDTGKNTISRKVVVGR